jgi:hypothetical protein
MDQDKRSHARILFQPIATVVGNTVDESSTMVECESYVELYEKLGSQHKAWYLQHTRPQLVTYDGKRRGTTICEVLQAYLSARFF